VQIEIDALPAGAKIEFPRHAWEPHKNATDADPQQDHGGPADDLTAELIRNRACALAEGRRHRREQKAHVKLVQFVTQRFSETAASQNLAGIRIHEHSLAGAEQDLR
jgi:hypothetical protein